MFCLCDYEKLELVFSKGDFFHNSNLHNISYKTKLGNNCKSCNISSSNSGRLLVVLLTVVGTHLKGLRGHYWCDTVTMETQQLHPDAP